MRSIGTTLLLVTAILALAVGAWTTAVRSSPDGGPTEADPHLAQADTGTIHGTVQANRPRDLANTLVYLDEVPGDYAPPAEPVVMNQRNQEFDPFLLPVLKGSTVRFVNDDNTGHNVFSPDGETYDLGTFAQGESRDHTFNELGVYTQLCHMHPSMVAYIAVLQNPFYTVADDSGAFEITGVPPGTYTLEVWNERKEADPQTVTVTAGGTSEVTVELH